MARVKPHNDVISAPINAVGLIESVLDDQKASRHWTKRVGRVGAACYYRVAQLK